MEHGETQYVLLARLAWNLLGHKVDSVMTACRDTEPHLAIRSDRGRRDVADAVGEGERWYLLWRGKKPDAADVPAAARSIAADMLA